MKSNTSSVICSISTEKDRIQHNNSKPPPPFILFIRISSEIKSLRDEVGGILIWKKRQFVYSFSYIQGALFYQDLT